MEDRRDWHRLLGVILQDYCQGSALEVELEKDLSLKQQLLDVILLHRKAGEPTPAMPDGFAPLATHNLITFKSHQETLDGWSMKELIGHHVNYRKQVSPSMNDLLPETDFRLIAVSARYPSNLAQQLKLTEVMQGVYDNLYGLDNIRLVVANQLQQLEHNAILHLFAASEEQVRYGAEHYRQRSVETSTLLRILLERYLEEGMSMAGTIEEFIRERMEKTRKKMMEEAIAALTPEDYLKSLTPELVAKLTPELLAKLPPEKRLEGLSPQQRLEGLSPDKRLEGLSPEQRLEGLSPEEIRAALKRLTNGDSSGS